MKSLRSLLLGFCLSNAIAQLAIGIAFPVKAQISPDGTTDTTVTPIDNGLRIDEGDRAGDNLFHSFEQFSIPTDNEAFFNNATDIVNIFSRVTGGDISNIDGLLRANGGANLFLINPRGIVFGEGARLDIGGSFYGSSADSILFDDGEFSATDTEEPPLLTVNQPLGLNLGNNSGDIAVNGSTLKVDSGEALALIGGNVTITGGQIIAPGANIELGGLTQAGQINFIRLEDEASFDLINFPEAVTRGNVTLINGTEVKVRAAGGGSIGIKARNLELSDASNLTAGIASGTNSTEAQAGDINIEADGTVSLDNESLIINQVQENAVGNTGNINLISDFLELTNGSLILSETSGDGSTGNVSLNANNITFDSSKIINQINSGAVGDVGITKINTNSFNLNNGSEILTQINGIGKAGNIEIHVSGNVTLDRSGILNLVNASGKGNAGDIIINANSLETKDLEAQGNFETKTFLLSKTVGVGNAGNINLNIEENITFETSSILSQVDREVDAQGVGKSGDIIVKAGSLILKNNSLWQASSAAQGDAGNIFINVTGDINLDSRNLILSQVLAGAEGDAGDILITAGGSLNSINSLIISDSKDLGDGGNITIDVGDTITLEGETPDGKTVFPSAIITGLDEQRDDTSSTRELISAAEGEAGSIDISARQLIMKDLAYIVNNTEDNTIGDAGDINISVDNLIVQDNAFISAYTENSFDGGFININAQTLDLIRGGKIITATDGGGNAGNINLNITDRIAIDGSGTPSTTVPGLLVDVPFIDKLQGSTGLFANATENAGGNSGNITIGVGEIEFIQGSDEFTFNSTQTTNEVSIVNRGVITAESLGTRSGGQISIRAGNLTLDNEGTISVSTDPLENIANSNTTPNKITLRIDDKLSLSNNSIISAQAFQNAYGGNIDIDAQFVIAELSSGNGNDIIASAEDGMGGNIDITTNAIFGIAERSSTPLNNTNDIDASSEFGLDGTVAINELDVNPTEALEELPAEVIDVARLVAQNLCQQGDESEFIFTGKGGIAPNPSQVRDGEFSGVDLVEPANYEAGEQGFGEAEGTLAQGLHSATEEEIIEAQGWIVNDRGIVELVAHKTDINGSSSRLKNFPVCPKQ